MSEKFTASNGHRFESRGPDNKGREVLSMVFMRPNDEPFHTERQFAADDVQALREFFLHERDQELGRWRWPEHPEYVVYSKEVSEVAPEPGVRVVHEVSGRSRDIGREVVGACDATVSRFGNAARAYFAAHPLPRPWHDAIPEEAWLLTVNGDEGVFLAHRNYLDMTVELTASNGTTVSSTDDEQITAGRRIWPEGVES